MKTARPVTTVKRVRRGRRHRRDPPTDPVKELGNLVDYAAHSSDVDFDGSSLMSLCRGYLRELNNTGLRERPEVADRVARLIPCLCNAKMSGWRGSFTQLASEEQHIFGAMIIVAEGHYRGVNTTRYTRRTHEGGGAGGTLRIKCLTECIIAANAVLSVNGLGYECGRGSGTTGGSPKGPPIKFTDRSAYRNNGGGGGPGQSAGYGTKGEGEFGGDVYGDEKLSTLHLGSGGGCDRGSHYAGTGGGALHLETRHLINRGTIAANGAPGNCCGGGSGGSIHIVVEHLSTAKGKIQALGGHCNDYKAGYGRIRIETHRVQIEKREEIVYGFVREMQRALFPELMIPRDVLVVCKSFFMFQLDDKELAAFMPMPYVG